MSPGLGGCCFQTRMWMKTFQVRGYGIIIYLTDQGLEGSTG
jgi:hypothetical protein